MTSLPREGQPPRTEVTLARTFDAPRALVWKAWTDPQMMARWWGPKGFTNPVCELDVRVGGKVLIHMQAPDGTVHPLTAIFDEVAEPECLVFRAVALDQANKPAAQIADHRHVSRRRRQDQGHRPCQRRTDRARRRRNARA